MLERLEASLETRRSWMRDDASAECPVTACVPLVIERSVIGAILVGRLLQQKNGFDDLDRELFEVLATHAATALYCATLHARKEELVLA
jgi:hypothetical protein